MIFEKTERHLKILKDLIYLLFYKEKKIKQRFFYTIFLILITIFLNIISPFVLKKIVGEFSLSIDIHKNYIFFLGFLYSFSWGLSQITVQLREIISFRIIERIIRNLTLKIFNKINILNINYFNHSSLGNILDTINKAQEGFPYLISGIFFYMIPTIIEIIFIGVILGFLLPLKFTCIFFLALTTYVIFTLKGLKKATSYQQNSIIVSQKTYSYLVDRLQNYETIKICGKYKFESKELDLHLKNQEESQTKFNMFIEYIRMIQGGILGLFLMILILIGIHSATNNQMRLEEFILINVYFMQLTVPLNYLGVIIKDIKNGLISLEKTYDLLNEKSEDLKLLSTNSTSLPFKNIELINVSFGYKDNQEILKDLNFSLEKGKIIGIVGKTGSGKSTLAKLLLRFYEPSHGIIYHDLKKYSESCLQSIRENIGYVSQEPRLFSDTILYNIIYDNPNASPENIQNAIEKACLNDLIQKLPNGIDTFIGEQGTCLSGGEKQRLNLARVFLTQKKLYIFDEATSALDCTTQYLIQKHINSLKKEAIVLLISHKLSTLVESDEILVMSGGAIIERGNHNTLVNAKGAYHQLWKNS